MRWHANLESRFRSVWGRFLLFYRTAKEDTRAVESRGRGDSHCRYDLWCGRKMNSYSARSSFKACRWDKIMQVWTFTAVCTEHRELWSLRVWELNLQPELDHSLLPHDRTPLYGRSNPGGGGGGGERKEQRGSYRAPGGGGVLAGGIVMGWTHDMAWCLYGPLRLFLLLRSLCTHHMWVFCTCLLILLNSGINCTKMSIRKRKTAPFLIFSP